jgi:hypothetical protein
MIKLVFMNNKYNLSKKNISFFLIVVIVIGIIVVITQMANVKGSQKPVDQLNQNPNSGHLTKIKSVSTTITSDSNVSLTKPLAATNNINNVTKPLAATNNINNVTKPLAATNNINNVTKPLAATNNINNVTKPLAATNNNGSSIIKSSQKNNTEMVNYQLFKTPKVDQISDYNTLKKSLINDVFGKSEKKSHGGSEPKDKLQSTQADNRLNTNNNFGENKKTSNIFKTHHYHKSTDSQNNDLNSNRSPRHNIPDLPNSAAPSNTIDLPLPFTAGVPNNLF